MKLRNIGSNQTELDVNGTTILFSYDTPVAAIGTFVIDGEKFTGTIRTRTKWSATTSKHITQWLNGRKAREVDQGVLDGLMGGDA